MARIRTIKPEFFTSEDIVSMSPLARLFYVSLWCESDREGRLEWKPRTFKLRYLPGDDVDIVDLAQELIENGLITLYEVGGKTYAQIPTFTEHQVINNRESESKIPALVTARIDASTTRESGVKAEGKGRERKGMEGMEQREEEPSPPAAQPVALPKKSKSKPASLPVSDLVAHGVDALVAEEFLALREKKRAPLSQIALDGIKREAEAVGWTLDQTLRKCVERGWQGFEAGWVTDKKTTGASRHGNFAKQDYRAGVAADGSF